jgi:hypothetical protein
MNVEGQDPLVSVVLAVLNVLQTVLLAWIASRGARRRHEDRYTGSGGSSMRDNSPASAASARSTASGTDPDK